MDDSISRQAAMDALDRTCNSNCPYSKKQRYAMCGACTLGAAFDALTEVPSVQGGKEMTVKKLIEELEIQHEAWGKQYTFEMILRDIEKYAEEEDHEADKGDR